MNLREFTKVTAKKLNESLAQKFGTRIDVDQFTTEQLLDARNKLRTKVFNVETTESFDSVQKEDYQKNKLFLDVLNAAISERDDTIIDAIDEAVEQVTEGAEDEAELVMAAKDMVDRVTGWMEDTAEMQTESMLELADAIRDEHGSEKSEAFATSVKPALESMYAAMESTRGTLSAGVGMLTGEGEAPMMGADLEGDSEMGPDIDAEIDAAPDLTPDDGMGADEAAAGGEEEAGRLKRESKVVKGKRIKNESKKKIAETSKRLATTLSKKKG